MTVWGAREVGAAALAAPRYLLGALLIIVTLLINLEVFLRFFINLPLDAISEIVLTLFPWLIMLGAAVALTVPGANVAIHLLSGRLSFRGRMLLVLLNNLAAILFGLFLIVQGSNYTAMVGGEISNELEIPRIWQSSAFPVAGMLFIIYSIVATFRMLRPSPQT